MLVLPFTLVMLTLHLLAVSAAPDVSGDLDAGFGAGGSVTIPISGTNQIGRAVAIQPDGKLVIAGYHNWNTGKSDLILARTNTDGSLDTSFGAGGIVTTSLSSGDDTAYAVAVQPDGKIVAAGLSTQSGVSIAAVVRYNTDGSLDATFGANGAVTTSLFPDSAFLLSVAVLNDGRIVAGGSVISSSSAPNTFLLIRYQANGALDTTLGGSGVVTTTIPVGDANSWGMAVQSDGKVLLGGFVRPPSGFTDFALARYNMDGSLDTSFGSGGIVTQTIAATDYGYGLVVQTSGKIIIGGKSGSNAALARYNSDGSYDNSFGPITSTNFITYAVPGYISTSVGDLTLQNNDYVVVAGGAYTPTQVSPVTVAVFDQDGRPDTNFGAGGIAVTINGTHFASGRAVLVQPDDKIVMAGYIDLDDAFSSYEYDLALWRYDYFAFQIYLPTITK
ncbi:MAG: delta-60 repeat domain-containing protein [Anaerolineae bacterium]